MAERTLMVGAVALIMAAIESEEKACPVHCHRDWEQRKEKDEKVCTCAHRRVRPIA